MTKHYPICGFCGRQHPDTTACLPLPPPVTVPHKCPVCDGTGKVNKPPWVAGDQPSWTDTSSGPYTCHCCKGCGIVWGPVA